MNHKLIEEKQKQIEDILGDLSFKEQNEVLFGVLKSFDFRTAANMVRSGRDIYMHSDVLYENTYAGTNSKGCLNLKEVLEQWMTIVNADKEYGSARVVGLVKPEEQKAEKGKDAIGDAIAMVKADVELDEMFMEYDIG